MWHFLYQREFLERHQIKFLNLPPHEDELFTFQCYIYADRIGFLNEIGYHHRYRSGSITTSEKNSKCPLLLSYIETDDDAVL